MFNSDRSAISGISPNTGDKLRAVVLSRDDPLMEGRVMVNIPRLIPDGDPASGQIIEKKVQVKSDAVQNKEISEASAGTVTTVNGLWARPRRQHTGDFRVPYVGATIYVFMEDGDPNKIYYEDSAPTLSGEVTPMQNVRNSADAYTPDKKPNIHVLHEFGDGTIIYYNENDDSREIHIAFSSGNTFSIEDNEKSTQIEAKTPSGYQLVLDDTNKNVSARTPGGHELWLSDGGGKSEQQKQQAKQPESESTSKTTTTTSSGSSEESTAMKNEIRLKTAGSSTVVMTGDGDKITVLNKSKTKVEVRDTTIEANTNGASAILTKDSITAKTGGSTVNMVNDSVTASNGGSSVKITSSTINASAGGGTVKIGGGKVQLN